MKTQITAGRLSFIILCAATAFIGLDAAGYREGVPATVPGVGFQLDAEIIKVILSALVAILPAIADTWIPGLGAIIRALLEMFIPKQQRTVNLETLAKLTDKFQGDAEAQAALQVLIAKALTAQAAPKPEATKT